MMGSHTARIGENFNKELDLIRDKRKEKRLDKKRISTHQLTNIIIKHDRWEEIKKDMMKVNLGALKNGN